MKNRGQTTFFIVDFDLQRGLVEKRGLSPILVR